ncbi:MAG: YybH family protein [Pyrinomonadaceae bacterium]
MIKRLLFSTTFVFALAATALAQNANTSPAPAAHARRSTPAKTNTTQPAQAATPAQAQPAAASARTRRAAQTPAEATQARAVRDAFDSLVDGIRRADAAAVSKLYWNSSQLTVFNNNGTVTKGWEQANSNRQSLYAKVSNVKLDVRDVRVKTLGASGAVVTCLWEQSQTADGQPEHATGRLTVVYQKVGAAWQIVHTHTSPDRPDPSRLLPSERTPTADADVPSKPTPSKP